MTTSEPNPSLEWLPAGMDPKSKLFVEFDKVVDSDVCNFKDLTQEIVDEFPHGLYEVVTVFLL